MTTVDNEKVSLGWKQLYEDLEVREWYPTRRLAELLTSLKDKNICELDFSGIDHVTDEVLLAIADSCLNTSLVQTIRSVYLIGCIYVTDFGIRQLTQTLTNLEVIYLDGCHRVTDESLRHLKKNCHSTIKKISMIGCSVSCDITWERNDPPNLILHGCPLLYGKDEDGSKPGQEVPVYKLAVLTQDVTKYNMVDFITSKKDIKEFPSGPKNTSFFRANVTVPSVDNYNFNTFELHSRTALMSPFLSEKAIYMVVADLDETNMTNFHLYIMARMNAVKAVVRHCPFIITILHREKTKKERIQHVDQLGDDLRSYLNMQNKTVDEYLNIEKYDSEHRVRSDFQVQQRYARSVQASKNIYTYLLYRVNVDTLEVQLHWPKQGGSAVNLAALKVELEKKMGDFQKTRLEPCQSALQRLNKSDITELKSFGNPPEIVVKVMKGMCILLRVSIPTSISKDEQRKQEWKAAKILLSDLSFLSTMLQYDQHNINEKQLDLLTELISDPQLTLPNIRVVSIACASFWNWVLAMYHYGKELKPEIDIYTAKLNAADKEETVVIGKGPEFFHTAIGKAVSDLEDMMYPGCLVQSSVFLQKVADVTNSMTDQKICHVTLIQDKLGGPGMADMKRLSKALEKLQIMGKLLYFPAMKTPVVVMDVQWFMDLLSSLQHNTKKYDVMRNGERCKALASFVPLFDKVALLKMLGNSSSHHQWDLGLDVARYFGIMLDVPNSRVKQQHTTNLMFLYSHLPENASCRQVGDKAEIRSGGHFKQYCWPANTTPDFLDTDVEMLYGYRLTLGIPPALIPQILAECVRIGQVVLAWKWAILARCGAVEVLIRHNVHGTMLSSSLDIVARMTRYSPETDDQVLQEYMRSVVNRYRRIIDYYISQYPHLHVKERVPCRGMCAYGVLPQTFSPVEFPSKLDFIINCPKCTAQGLTDRQMDFFIGGSRDGLPFHFYRPLYYTDDTMCKCSAYSKSPCSDYGDDNFWICVNCGITQNAALKQWTMESSLFPAFAGKCFRKLFVAPEQDHVTAECIDGNIAELPTGVKKMLILCKQQLLLNGLTGLEMTVLSEGTIKLVVFREESYSKELLNDVKLAKVDLSYNLSSGLFGYRVNKPLEALDDAATYEERTELAEQTLDNFRCSMGDRLALDITRMKLLSDHCGKNMVLEVSLRYNGQTIATTTIPYRSSIGILLEDTGSGRPKIILQAPTFPMVTTAHFPLGSAVFYKKGVTKAFAVGKIFEAKDGLLCIGSRDGTSCKWLPPDSKDILPVGLYSESFPILLDKDVLKKKDQLVRYLWDNRMFPAPQGLFTCWETSASGFSPISIGRPSYRFCTVSPSAPQALEQAFLNHMSSEGKSLKSKQAPCFLFLPANLKSDVLLNPVRQITHNWNSQSLHFLCRGTSWTQSSSFERDSHFMDLEPVDIDRDKFYNINGCFTRDTLLAYHCMDIQQGNLPYWPKVLPQLLEGDTPPVDQIEVSTGLAELISLYKYTFLLIDRLQESRHADPTKKWPAGAKLPNKSAHRDVTELYSEHAKTLQVNTRVASRCISHNAISKRTFVKYLSTGSIGEYIDTIKYLTIKHQPVSDTLIDVLKLLVNLEGLVLSSCDIRGLDEMVTYKRLRVLNISFNKITHIPDEFIALKDSLEILDISWNPLTQLPDFITQFHKLRTLTAGDTLISSLPEDIGLLSNLKVLDMKATLINKLPDSFRHLRNLDVLVLQGVPWLSFLGQDAEIFSKQAWMDWTKKCFFPISQMSITEKEQLFTECNISANGSLNGSEIIQMNKKLFQKFPRFGQNQDDDKYGGIPRQIFYLKRLRILALTYQGIRFIPKEIIRLPRLQKVMLSNNPHLETLNGGMGELPLKVITLDNCHSLRTPPQEILSQGMSVVIAYLKRLSQGSAACYRTKLMFVGLGGAGKTSLMRALMSSDNKAPTAEGEGITDGIDIHTWSIVRQNVNITYSVWDFAGQTVYYNTHQFFLSSRAVYLLIWNTRLGFEHSGLEFWLSSVACHSPKAPLFVVGTHADQITNPELPVDLLKKRYNNIAGFFTVSSVTGQGVKELMDKLLEVTLQQPYIGEMIPQAWLNLERAIMSKRNEASLLPWEDIERITEHSGVYGAEIKQAIQFLHELGTLQHFDNELLKDRVVINPQWIVDVMACVVSVHNRIIKEGHLKHKDISKIWADYPKELHEWLLRLTEVFDLTFPLQGQRENIVPCLLPRKEPEYNWPRLEDEKGATQSKMIYKFDYLPAGLFNRAQVRLYQYSDSVNMWKSGSLLHKNDHVALVQQVGDTEVIVKVFGQRPGNILLMVHEVFEGLISEFFRGVKYEYKIPCPDCVKVSTAEPTMFSSKVLRRAIELKALFLQCHSFFHTLSVSDIQSIMPPQSTSDFDLQLQNAVHDLDEMQVDLSVDVFFLFAEANLLQREHNCLDPLRLRDDLEKEGYKSWFAEKLSQKKVEEVAVAMKNSKVVLVLISDEFVQDDCCQRLFKFLRGTLRKTFVLLMVGKSKDWMKSEIGLQLTHMVYVNFQRAEHYNEKLKELLAHVQTKVGRRQVNTDSQCDVFLSYCWANSAEAVKSGQTRSRDGALGQEDPRKIKTFLENNKISCWLDVERTGKTGLFEDIADGMRHSRLVIACVSDEYALSSNCQMEFRFAHVALRRPIVLAVVGTGFKWESTEVGMLSLGYPKINFQIANSMAYSQILLHVQEQLAAVKEHETQSTNSPRPHKELAFQELYELAQRKFLRQITGYVEGLEPYPRLFVADLSSTNDEQDENSDVEDTILVPEQSKNSIAIEHLTAGQFSIKTLCEYDGGWHSVQNEHPVDLGGHDLATLWQVAAPYMARVFAILKHSNVDLHLLRSDHGNKFMHHLEQKARVDRHMDMKPIYLKLRNYVMAKDIHRSQRKLARCHLPNGKVLWLCDKHQRLPRVTVLDALDDVMTQADLETDSSSSPELLLLTALKEIDEEQRDYVRQFSTEEPLTPTDTLSMSGLFSQINTSNEAKPPETERADQTSNEAKPPETERADQTSNEAKPPETERADQTSNEAKQPATKRADQSDNQLANTTTTALPGLHETQQPTRSNDSASAVSTSLKPITAKSDIAETKRMTRRRSDLKSLERSKQVDAGVRNKIIKRASAQSLAYGGDFQSSKACVII